MSDRDGDEELEGAPEDARDEEGEEDEGAGEGEGEGEGEPEEGAPAVAVHDRGDAIEEDGEDDAPPRLRPRYPEDEDEGADEPESQRLMAIPVGLPDGEAVPSWAPNKDDDAVSLDVGRPAATLRTPRSSDEGGRLRLFVRVAVVLQVLLVAAGASAWDGLVSADGTVPALHYAWGVAAGFALVLAISGVRDGATARIGFALVSGVGALVGQVYGADMFLQYAVASWFGAVVYGFFTATVILAVLAIREAGLSNPDDRRAGAL